MKFIYEATAKSVDEAIDIACAEAGVGLTEAEIEVLELGSKGFFGIGQKEAKVRLIVERPDSEAEKRPPVTKIAAPMPEPEAAPQAGEASAQKSERAVPAVKRNEGRRRDQDRRNKKGETKAAKPAPPKREPRPVIPCDPEAAQAAAERGIAFLQPIFAKLQVAPSHTFTLREDVMQIVFAGENLGALIGRRGETLNALQYLVNLAANKTGGEHVRLVLDVEGYRQGREETLINLAHKMADKSVRTGRRVELEPMSPQERRVVHLALQEDSRVETLSRGEEPYRRVVISCKRSSRHR